MLEYLAIRLSWALSWVIVISTVGVWLLLLVKRLYKFFVEDEVK